MAVPLFSALFKGIGGDFGHSPIVSVTYCVHLSLVNELVLCIIPPVEVTVVVCFMMLCTSEFFMKALLYRSCFVKK